MGAATHLPFRAGHNRMHTAKAGCMGSFCSPCFYVMGYNPQNYCKLFSFFLDFPTLPLESENKISYNTSVYA